MKISDCDYKIRIFGFEAFTDSKAYKILESRYKIGINHKLDNAIVDFEYLSKINRFTISGNLRRGNSGPYQYFRFVKPNNHEPIYSEYVIGDTTKTGILFSIYLRVEDHKPYLVFTSSLITPGKYSSELRPTRENTKILAKYPLDYPGLDEKEVDSERLRLGWKSNDMTIDDNVMLYDIFGEEYMIGYSEEVCNGVAISYSCN